MILRLALFGLFALNAAAQPGVKQASVPRRIVSGPLAVQPFREVLSGQLASLRDNISLASVRSLELTGLGERPTAPLMDPRREAAYLVSATVAAAADSPEVDPNILRLAGPDNAEELQSLFSHFRALDDASHGDFSHAVLFDYDGMTTAFNRVNVEMINTSRDRFHYLARLFGRQLPIYNSEPYQHMPVDVFVQSLMRSSMPLDPQRDAEGAAMAEILGLSAVAARTADRLSSNAGNVAQALAAEMSVNLQYGKPFFPPTSCSLRFRLWPRREESSPSAETWLGRRPCRPWRWPSRAKASKFRSWTFQTFTSIS